jgi:hypothetical protein
MKINFISKIVFAFLITILILSCRKDPIPTLNTCDNEIIYNSEEYFLNDAMELTLRYTTIDTLSPFHNDPYIDEQLQQHILGKLSAIYNASADSLTVFYEIIHDYKIHVHQTYTFDDLAIKFSDTTLENEFISNPGYTSSAILNSITNSYGFNLTFDVVGWYFLHSNTNYNIPVLCAKLITEPRIQYANPNFFCCDGDNIVYNRTDQYDEFIFDHGMGDCPSGCFGHHFWKIRVDKDCNVTLADEYGDPLPG